MRSVWIVLLAAGAAPVFKVATPVFQVAERVFMAAMPVFLMATVFLAAIGALTTTGAWAVDDVVQQSGDLRGTKADANETRELPTQYAEWIDQLQSSSFETRRGAFLKLWAVGDEVLPALVAEQSAASASSQSSERQLSDSLASLQLLLKLGITQGPDATSLRLVELLSDITPPKIVELCKLEYWELASELIRSNASLHDALSDDYGQFTLNQIAEIGYSQNRLDDAWSIVRESVPPQQASWIAHKLQYELPGLEVESNDAKAIRLYYAGDTDGAIELVESPALRIPMLTRGFRWQAFQDESIQLSLLGVLPSNSQLAARAVLSEIGGDLEGAQAVWDEILVPVKASDAGSNDDDEREGNAVGDPQSAAALALLREVGDPVRGNVVQHNQLVLALLMAGRVEPVEQFLEETNKTLAFSFYSARNNFGKTFEQVGLTPDLTNFEEWLSEQAEAIPGSLIRGGRQELDLATRTAAILVGIGQTERATQLLEMLAKTARDQPKFEVTIWKDSIVRWLGRHESRAICRKIAESNYELMSAECQEQVLEGLHAELGSVAPRLFAAIPDHSGHALDSPWTTLEKLRLWDRDYFGKDSEVYISKWLRRTKQSLSREELTSERLSQLAQIADDLGFDELALELLSTDIREVRGPQAVNLHWLDAAEIYNRQLKPELALPLLSIVRESGFNLQRAYVCEIDSLLMAGEYDRATALNASRWVRPLSIGRYYGASYSDVARQFSDREDYARAMEYAEPAFLFAETSSRFAYWAASEYAELAEEANDYQKSADVQRAPLVEALQPYSSLMQFMMANGYISSIRYSVQQERLARAIACVEKKDLEGARRHLQVSHALQPQDIEVVVQCYPRLMKAGEAGFAQELFDLYEAELEQQISQWPNDATAVNNLAWMYSQCDQKLDEALALAKRGVALAPSSPVFLDTLAEVEYRLGQFGKATESMLGCVRLDPRDTHYRENLVRFRNGAK